MVRRIFGKVALTGTWQVGGGNGADSCLSVVKGHIFFFSSVIVAVMRESEPVRVSTEGECISWGEEVLKDI